MQALVAVENELIGQQRRTDRGLPATKQELYDSILLAIGWVSEEHTLNSPDLAGIPADKARMLRDKISRGVFDIFLAHNAQEHTQVSRLARELRRRGINPWLDSEQIAPGRWFQDVIQAAIRTVKSAAVIIGRSGVGRWQEAELRAVLNRCIEQKIPVIPILLPGRDSVPDELTFLSQLHFVRFKNDVTEPEALSNLIWGITGTKPL